MARVSTLAALAAAAMVGGVPATGSADTVTGSAVRYQQCSGSYGGGFWRSIRAKAVTCAEARRVTRAWVLALPPPEEGVSTVPPVEVLGYACTSRFIPDRDGNGRLSVLCILDSGAKAVRFVGSP